MARQPKRRSVKGKTRSTPWPPSRARLEELTEEALVDAYNEDEQRHAFFAALDKNLALPFETSVLGVTARVDQIDLATSGEIVAILARRGHALQIGILDLPLPRPLPDGAEWIEAYRYWARGG
jgi:hypothetical protein